MMNRKEFFDYVKDHVKEYLPESYQDAQINLRETMKNNGLKLTGIEISENAAEYEHGQRIVPRIYLDSVYQAYTEGKSLNSCVSDVAEQRLVAEEKAVELSGIPNLADYNSFKDRLQMKICDLDWNADLLANRAYTVHGDFAATYAINLSENSDGIASVPITNQMVQTWNITMEQLHSDAMAADLNRGAKLMSMDDLMSEMVFGGGDAQNLLDGQHDVQDYQQPMFCLTNEGKINGASLILHEDIRQQIGEFMQGDYFILPSSIHECLIVPDDGNFQAKDLNAMVKEINEVEVAQEDRLSDKVQHCERGSAVMENAEKRDFRIEQEKALGKSAERTADRNSEKGQEKGGIHAKLEKAKSQAKTAERGDKPKVQHRDKAMAL